MQRFDEAEALLLESRAVLTRHAPDRPNDLRRVHNHLEALYRAWDRPEQAAAFAEATS
jgi:hypothetical protein